MCKVKTLLVQIGVQKCYCVRWLFRECSYGSLGQKELRIPRLRTGANLFDDRICKKWNIRLSVFIDVVKLIELVY